jgi:tetratricopeptide (TPR) repeat protein
MSGRLAAARTRERGSRQGAKQLACGGAGRRRFALAAVQALVLATACSGEVAPPPPVIADLDGVEPQLVALIRERAAAVEAAPRDARARAMLGLVYEANSLWSPAARSFESAFELEPDEPLWALHAAHNRQREGDAAGALAYLREHGERFAGSAPLQHGLGELLLLAGDPSAAELAFDRAVAAAPECAEGYAGRGEARLEQRDGAGARADLERALAIDPDYQSARYLLGRALRELGQHSAAERELALGAGGVKRPLPDALADDATRFAVSRVERLEYAAASLEQGKPRQALLASNAVLEDFPADEQALTCRAKALIQLERWQPALEATDQALAHHPQSFHAWLDRAIAALHLGRTVDARAALERARELKPQSFYVPLYFSSYHLATGDAPAALASAEEACELAPGRAEVHVALGRCLLATGAVDRARAALEQALELAPGNAAARSELERLAGPPSSAAGRAQGRR